MDFKSIVEGCRNAEPDKIRALYESYSDRMMKQCMSYVKSEDEAYDLFHDAFLLIVSKISQLKEPQKLESWMSTIVRNLALQHLRHKKKYIPGAEEIEIEEEVSSETYPPVPLEVLIHMINGLPEQYGKVFRMSVLDGLSHKEIGNILGIEERTSSSNLYRARIILQGALKKYWGGLLILLVATIVPFLHKGAKMQIPSNRSRLIQAATDTLVIDIQRERIKITPIVLSERTPDRIVMEVPDSTYTQLDTTEKREYVIITKEKPMEKTEKYPAWENVDWGEDEKPKRRRKGAVRMHFSNLPGSTSRLTAMSPDNGLLADMLPKNENLTSTPTRIDSWSDLERLFADLAENYPDSTMYTSLHAIAKGMTESGNDDLKENREYAQPVTFGLTANIGLSSRWSLISGLEYSRLSSKASSGIDTVSVTNRQTIHYLGIPLGASYEILSKGRINISASAYGRLDIPVAAASIIEHHNGNIVTYRGRTSMNVPMQWSVGSGICFRYTIGSNISLYVEPQLQYHFSPAGNVNTIWTERPLDLAVPIGIRFSW